ncbi:MAG: 2-oxoacid:ferredoxin oxidoreductase subunit beta [Anaerolineae bacterium]|nr:2-oxoacid:ferredoxin oxidoreductase subunit beta [Anaerolineae bacterium]
MATVEDYSNDIRPTWCQGCGDYGIWNAVKRGLVQAGLEPHQVIIVSGIGCGSKISDYMHVNGLHTLHGRTVAVATGFKLANPDLKVLCVHGDGDGYGEGGNHFLHATRRNIGIVDMIENNHVYGLTKGQYSPTSRPGFRTSTSPEGAIDSPVSPLALAISQGATFVARGFALDLQGLAALLVEALNHRGYALIDVMQPCVSFNRPMSYAWYRERVYKVEDEGHDPGDRMAAMARALEYPGGERIPTGIIYRDETKPSYEEQLPALQAGSLVAQPLRTRPAEDYELLLQEFI